MRNDLMCLDIIDHPAAWRPADLADESTWVITLDDNQVDELEGALSRVQGREYSEITRETFPLPTLGKVLEEAVDIVEHGRGVMVVRGLPVEGRSVPEARRMYFGLSTHIGRATSQDRTGRLLNDVMDHADRTKDRGALNNQALGFHSDPSDILALLCLSTALAGGLSSVASAMTVHNHLLEHHRELLGLLYKEYCYGKGEAQVPGEPLFFRSQIFGYFDGRLACRYLSRPRLNAAQDMTGIPLSPVEVSAIDRFEATAADASVRHDFALRPGHMLLLSNSYALHARTAFEDGGDDRQRHLLRLALNPYVQREFPPGFAPYREGHPVVTGSAPT